MIGTNQQVAHDFVNDGRYDKSGTGNLFWKQWGDTRTIYSYGHHYAVAIYYNGMFLVNGDRYSNTTIRHTNAVINELPRESYTTTSFSALQRALGLDTFGPGQFPIVDEIDIGRLRIIDVQKEQHRHVEEKYVYRLVSRTPLSLPAWEWVLDKTPGDGPPENMQGWTETVSVFERQEDPYDLSTRTKTIWKRYHRPPYILFEYSPEEADDGTMRPKKQFIAGMDEGSYFISELPGNIPMLTSTIYALSALKPQAVQTWEDEHDEAAKRQGEWFFLPLEDTEAKDVFNGLSPRQVYKKELEQKFHLPYKRGGNPHFATRGITKDGFHVVSGGITHSQHGRLQLSYHNHPKLFLAVENTAVNSYSADGQVD